ncbi:MAG: AraC family transcriptional regulator [Verrucomicrobiota bacterium]
MKAHIEQILTPQENSFLCKQIVSDQFDHPFHFHREIELTLILKSSGTRIVGDHIGDFGPGDLSLLGENLPHIFRNTITAKRGSKAEAEVLQFSSDCANGVLDTAPEFRQFSSMLDLAKRGLVFDAATSKQVAELLPRVRESEGVRRWLSFLEIVDHLVSAPEPKILASAGFGGASGLDSSNRVGKACQYILEHFDQNLTHEMMAAHTHTSAAYFSRLFRKTTQKTFTEFLTEVRLGHVCRLLTETDLPIVEIAYDSGFRNLSAFNRRFREVYNCSPREFRKAHI